MRPALLLKRFGLPMEAALILAPLAAGAFAVVYGWFCVRLSGVYLAMLTLGLRADHLVDRLPVGFASPAAATACSASGRRRGSPARRSTTTWRFSSAAPASRSLWRVLFSPFGYALRAGRDSPLRAEAIGIDVRGFQWAAFVLAGAAAGLAGAVYRLLQGQHLALGHLHRPVDRRPGHGAAGRCRDAHRTGGRRGDLHLAARRACAPTEFWRAVLGCVILLIVLLFPQGLVGGLKAPDRALARGPLMSKEGMTAVLQVEGLHKTFGGVQAVADVSFAIDAGELLALIGPNGAGKSTCFNMLNGQLAPDAGIVRLGGRDIVGLRPRAIWRLGVGRTFQITATFASLSVRENVQMALYSHAGRLRSLLSRFGAAFAAEADALLDQIGMLDQAERTCGVLAYGDLKRVELAMALANQPRLLLMDEPTAGMAPKERIELMALTAPAGAGAQHRRAVHRARHGRGVRPGRPHHRARPRPADRRRHARRGARQPQCARGLSRERSLMPSPGVCDRASCSCRSADLQVRIISLSGPGGPRSHDARHKARVTSPEELRAPGHEERTCSS